MGLRVVGDQPDRFARVVAANTTLPVIPRGMNPFRVPNPVEINCDLGDFAKPTDLDASTWPKYFQQWILYTLTAPNFIPSQVVAAMTVNALAPGEAAAYNVPYPSLIYKAAVRAFSSMLAAMEDQNTPPGRRWERLRNLSCSLLGRKIRTRDRRQTSSA